MATEDEDLQDPEVTPGENLVERLALNDAYAALLGAQATSSFHAFTFEEAVDAQIERIEGKGTQKRPNQLTRVQRIRETTKQAVKVLKATPPEDFIEPTEDDVNT